MRIHSEDGRIIEKLDRLPDGKFVQGWRAPKEIISPRFGYVYVSRLPDDPFTIWESFTPEAYDLHWEPEALNESNGDS